MSTYEWVLATPKTKDFERKKTTSYEVDEPVTQGSGLPVWQKVKKELVETVIESSQTNIVRLVSAHNDVENHRIFVRFYYGRLEDGVFVTPQFDDGVVFGGPTYLEHEFHTNPTAVEEKILLQKIATTLKWDGAMRALPPPL